MPPTGDLLPPEALLPQEELLSTCNRRGVRGENIEECLQDIEGILHNSPTETRKENLNEILESLVHNGSGGPELSTAKRLLQTFYAKPSGPKHPASQTESELRQAISKLHYPDDAKWKELLQKYELINSEVGRHYGQRLVQMTNNYLNQPSQTEIRCQRLCSLKELFDAVLDKLSLQLDGAERFQLKNWIVEIARLEEEQENDRIRMELQAAVEQKDWDQGEHLAKLLQNRVQRDEEARRALLQVRRYRKWREVFDEVVPSFTQFHCSGQLAFPWDAVDSAAPELADVRKGAAGVEKWGKEHDQQVWVQALEHVSTQILESLQQSGDGVATLKDLKKLHQAWPVNDLGVLPLEAKWTQVQTELASRIGRQAEGYFETFRDNYDGKKTVPRFLEENSELLRLIDSGAAPAYDQFLLEVEKLDRLHTKIQAWKGEADLVRLPASELEDAERELQELASSWERAPLHERLTEEVPKLRQELETLTQVGSSLDQDPNQVSAKLIDITLLGRAATKLREKAEQNLRDKQIYDRLTETGPDGITKAELESLNLELRLRYEEYKRGSDYIKRLQSDITVLEQDSDFSTYLTDGGKLLQTALGSIPEQVQLCAADKRELKGASSKLRDRWIERAEQEAERLLDESQPTPLLEPRQLVRLCKRREVLQHGLSSEPKYAQLIQDRIKPASIILNVHQGCHDALHSEDPAAWAKVQEYVESVSSSDDSSLSREQQDSLLATVLSKRYLNEGAEDPAWLALYKNYPKLLLEAPDDRAHYLELLRRSAFFLPDSPRSLEEHLLILEDRFPAEAFLTQLFDLAINPSNRQAQRLTRQHRPGDEIVLRQLLVQWSTELDRYQPLCSLWDRLDGVLRQQAWDQPEAPPQKLHQVFESKLREWTRALEDPAQNLGELEEKLEKYTRAGLLENNQVGKTLKYDLKNALEIERGLKKLEGQDPWNPDPDVLRSLEDLVGHFQKSVLDQRGWEQALVKRREGIKAWAVLEDAWKTFHGRFDWSDLRQSSTTGWPDLIRHLDTWCAILDRAASQVSWELPRAQDSQRWKNLYAEWQGRHEGKLWLTGGREPPQNLKQLQASYREVLSQAKDFATLHDTLLRDIPRFNPDPLPAFIDSVREPLTKLHRVRPLSKPVEEIKRQLTDPDMSNVGGVYRNLGFP